MAAKGLTLWEWDTQCEKKLARYAEQSKFLGDAGVDIESLAKDMQGFFNMGGFDIRAFKTSGRVFAKSYSDYKTGLEGILQKFRSNAKAMGISAAKTAAIQDFRSLCTDVYSSAFKAGAMRVGNPAVDELGISGQKIVKTTTGVESGFFRDRLDAAIDPAMDDVIVGGYADSLKSQYFNGMVGGADINQKFIWRLGSHVEIHCGDCLSLSAGGPYTKATLMTVPRGGDTECLWRCDCSLQLLGGVASQVGAALRPGEENLSATVTGLSGEKVSMDTAKMFSDLYDQVNRARVAFEFAVDEAEKKAIIARKSLLAQSIIDLQSSLGVRVTPVWSVGDLKAVTAALKTKGYTLIKDIAQISLGSKIFLLEGTGLKTAIVKAISRAGITLDVNGKIVVYRTTEDFVGFAK